MLLALDPFVAGGPTAALSGPRYQDVNAELGGPVEYGGGSAIIGSHQHSYNVGGLRTTASYDTPDWGLGPGWLGKLFGATTQTVKSHVAVSRAAGEYAFYSREIPEGSGTLVVGREPPQTVVVGKAWLRPEHF